MKFTKEQKRSLVDDVLSYMYRMIVEDGVGEKVYSDPLDVERIIRLELNKRERVRKNMPRVAIP